MDVDPDDWGERPTDPRTRREAEELARMLSEVQRAAYLAGVRAGLRAAGEVCEEDAAGLERIAGDMERQGLGSQRTHALTAARACRDAARRIAALDAEEVAGREP